MSLNLNNLLIELGHKDPPLRLTIDDIVATIDAYRENNDKNPNITIGTITHGPLAQKITWNALSQALKHGSHELQNDTKWQNLKLNNKSGNITLDTLLIELEYKEPPLRLTMEDIIATIEAYRTTHDNQNPTQRSKEIKDGPLTGKRTWVGLNQALKGAYKGLKDDPAWQKLNKKYDGNLTLAKLNKEYPFNLNASGIDYDAPEP